MVRRLQQAIDIERWSVARDRRACAARKASAARRPSSRSMVRNSHSALSLEDAAELGQHLAARSGGCACAPSRAPSLVARIGDLPQQRHHAQLLQQHRVERHLVQAVEDVARRARRARALDRIDLRRGSCRCDLHSRTSGVMVGIAGIAAVPIGLAIDLDRLEHGRQAGRGQQHVGRDLGVAEHAAAAGADVGRGDEQLDRRLRQPREIDLSARISRSGLSAAGLRS